MLSKEEVQKFIDDALALKQKPAAKSGATNDKD